MGGTTAAIMDSLRFGDYYVIGRKKDIIIVAGNNI